MEITKNKIIGFMLLVIVAAVAIKGYLYLNDYYESECDESYAQSIGVMKSENSKCIVYGDAQYAKIGFVFYPGAKVDEQSYEPVMSQIAQGNIAVMVAKMPFHLAVFDKKAAGEIMSDYPNIEKWYIGGHSLGGVMASVYAQNNPGKFDGVVFMASYASGVLSQSQSGISIRGDKDAILSMDKYNKAMKENDQLVEYIIEGGNHSGFGDYGLQSGDNEADIPKEEQWKQIAKITKEWILQKNQ